MKILYYFKEQSSVMFQWQRKHIIDELYLHGHEIDVFNPLSFKNYDEANERLLQLIKKENYQLFMTAHNEEVLYIETLKAIKKNGIPTLLICFDNLVVPYHWKNISNVFDLVWLTSKETKYLFDKWGCNSVFLPYAANPNFLNPKTIDEVPCIGFIGNPYGSRIHRINTLLENGIDICIHTKSSNTTYETKIESKKEYLKVIVDYLRFPIGRKLAYGSIKQKMQKKESIIKNKHLILKDPVPLEEMGSYLSKYALSLAFTDAKSTGLLKNSVPIVNLRTFEIPMAGGLQIATYTDELASYFEDGKEIILCRSIEEFIDKSKFYLQGSNSELRKNMKIQARKRAEAEHTWYRRFSVVFNRLNID